MPRFRREYLDAIRRLEDDPLVVELTALPAGVRTPLRAAISVAVADRSLLAEWRGDQAAEAVAADVVAAAGRVVALNETNVAEITAAISAQLAVRRAGRGPGGRHTSRCLQDDLCAARARS